jgi:hypothetical protein
VWHAAIGIRRDERLASQLQLCGLDAPTGQASFPGSLTGIVYWFLIRITLWQWLGPVNGSVDARGPRQGPVVRSLVQVLTDLAATVVAVVESLGDRLPDAAESATAIVELLVQAAKAIIALITSRWLVWTRQSPPSSSCLGRQQPSYTSCC